ncbi:MAG: HAMP domain-containing protein [Planctomycetes bacterium]|nr:HAMP domain-containing protein [Planctomycetota bacterium]
MLRRLGIQSKLILLLLAVTLASIAVVGWIGFSLGKRSIREATEARLTALRACQTAMLQSMLAGLRDLVISLSDGREAIEGTRALAAGFRELGTQPLSAAELDRLEAYYRDEFIPRLAERIDAKPVLEQYLPEGAAAQRVQERWIASNPLPAARQDLAEHPDDDSAYAAAHARFHPAFARAVRIFRFEDIMLIDAETLDIVYSYQKTPEFGTNLETGPYAGTLLAAKVRSLRGDRDRDDFRIVDFERYRPSLGKAMGFALSPIFDGAQMIGILAIQFPIDSINKVLTNSFDWQSQGLGASGECYLVGPDHTLRSRSRFMHEDPTGFVAGLRASGVPAATCNAIERQGSGLCLLPIRGLAAEEALRGQSGFTEGTDYRGTPVYTAYGPIDLDSLRWGLLAEIDVAEADAPIRRFGRTVVGVASGLALGSTLLALLFSHLLTRPLVRLADAARRLGAGETDVAVPVATDDEFGRLGRVFNDMAIDIRQRKEQLEQQVTRNEELLLSILPASAVEQRRDGDERASREFADVTVLCADLAGVDALAARDGDARALAAVGDLVAAIDEAAEAAGVEKVRAIGGSYLAVCGLSVARPDHTRRMIEFGRSIERLVAAFQREHRVDVRAAIGINCGPVVGGVVGRRKFLYDLWGDTVAVARRLAADGTAIRVTGRVRERTGDLFTFHGPESVTLEGRAPIETWSLDRAEGR